MTEAAIMVQQKVHSVLEFDKILNYLQELAITDLAAERIQSTFPLPDLESTQLALSRVTEVRNILDYDTSLPIESLKDIRRPLRKSQLDGTALTVDEFSDVADTLKAIHRLRNFLKDRDDKYPLLHGLLQNLASYQGLAKEIDRCIDLAQKRLRDSASPALARIRRDISRSEERARRRLEETMRKLARSGVLQEQQSTVRDGRLVLVVKEEHKGRVKGFIHDRSSTGASLFIEPIETFDLNNQIRELRIAEAAEEERILRSLTSSIGSRHTDLTRDLETLGELDFIHAKALFSRQLDANQPELNKGRIINIVEGRHPLLVLRSAEYGQVVPLNLTLGDEFNTLIVTGPNAGGKTVALKTVGLLTLMAQSGLLIPAAPHSSIGLFGTFFAYVGDEQSIEKDLSTFSSHVANLRTILKEADENSLVLVDEIGSGTDPEEGAALAMSILEQLTERGCRTVVTTHQGILKAFAFRTEGVENASMEFDLESLQPTYRFRTSIPGSSYAFEIAQRLGLPDEVISRSRQHVGKQKDRVEELILELEEKLQKYRALVMELDIKDTRLSGLIKLYQERNEALSKEARGLKKRAVEESEEILRQANAVVEKAVREIREKQASREAISSSKTMLAKQREETKRIEESLREGEKKTAPAPKRPGPIREGDHVIWTRYDSPGVVASAPDGSGRVLLQTGSVSTRVPINELAREPESQKAKRKIVATYSLSSTETASDEVDLRGLESDEAIEQVEKFLDTAILTGLHVVRIIHGKGTGTLRKNVGQFLKTHPRVKRTRLGAWNEGGTGVTIAELNLD